MGECFFNAENAQDAEKREKLKFGSALQDLF